MNLNTNPKKDELKALLNVCDDEASSHIFYVTKTGDVKIHEVGEGSPSEWAQENRDNFQFRLETCVAGNGYTGPEAADDEKWVNRLFIALKENWENKSLGYIDNF